MSQTGIITGFAVKKNRNGDHERLMLQVEMSSSEDPQTVEYVPLPGQDDTPIIGSKVYIIQVSDSYKIGIGVDDGIIPEGVAGRKRMYSLDADRNIKALIRLMESGIIELNGTGDFAVRFDALDTAFQTFVGAVNAVLSTKLDGSGTAGTLTLDISGAKVEKVTLP